MRIKKVPFFQQKIKRELGAPMDNKTLYQVSQIGLASKAALADTKIIRSLFVVRMCVAEDRIVGQFISRRHSYM